MIQWNGAKWIKPAVNTSDTADKFDKLNNISPRVIVRLLDKDGFFCGFTFGRYHHNDSKWVVEGYLGEFSISHWSHLNQPE